MTSPPDRLPGGRPSGGAPDHTSDDELWATLRLVANQADPVPAHVLDAAKATLSWRDPDAALAALVADSAELATPAGVRGGGAPRLLTFTSDALTIEVEASPADRWIRLVGQLVPAGPAQIRIDHRTGQHDLTADDLGRFTADHVAPGPVRLACTLASGGPPVRTSWILL